ncbi:acid protease [Stipitochalara longipes BDJ]|nr:acid protease [Stipitochalara longipes BDJ]
MHFLMIRSAISATLLLSSVIATSIPGSHDLSLRRKNFQVSEHSLFLTRKSRAKRTTESYLRQKRGDTSTIGSDALAAVADGQVFITNITFGTQSFQTIVDTGSSDTWVPVNNFTCVTGPENTPTNQSACGFGSTYTIDSTFNKIEGQNFRAEYDDGEIVVGDVGTETITLAGIVVSSQEIGLVNIAAFHGDGVSTGLLGLAFPSLTGAFQGTDFNNDQRNLTGVPYNPVFTTMHTTGLIEPVLSVDLRRDTTGGDGLGGSITFGGIPAYVQTTGSFATASLEIPNVESVHTLHFPELQSYIITIDGIVLPGAGNTPAANTGVQYIIDTGSSLNFFDSSSAAAIGALFDPPANVTSGAIFVDCAAEAPSDVGVMIGGQVFSLNSADLIVPNGLDSTTCVSGVQDGGNGDSDGALVLGDVFLKSVLAVFDVGHGNMQFALKV